MSRSLLQGVAAQSDAVAHPLGKHAGMSGPWAAVFFLALGLGLGLGPLACARGADDTTPKKPARVHSQVGKAAIYAKKFANRKMANGRRMDPNDSNAASKTLPLGTRARVTNLETGKSAVVTIEDRGPYVRGRVVDLSPATAEQIGLERKQGVAPVEVTPLEVPQKSKVASAE
jgi:rare lipoprotein A